MNRNYVLSNELKLPIIGFGTWKLINNEETIEIIKNAVKCGYRLFDTASVYGNEEAIGKGLIETNVSRSELLISGKLWNDDRGYNNTIAACKRTIKKLNCEYLDIYLIHWPASKAVHNDWEAINAETWKAFEYLYNEGLVKAIGVCNFKKNQLEALLKTAKIKPMINQIEYHIGYIQEDTVKYCKENDILVEAWSPLASGKILKSDILNDMAKKYGVSSANLCIKWCIQNGVLPLPKSANFERMKQNISFSDYKISQDDMVILNEMPYIGGFKLDSETITLFK